jgi:peptide/nickel transport system substrate-binding protein
VVYERKITRRRFIALTAGSVVAVSCGSSQEAQESGGGAKPEGFDVSGTPTKYREAPMLAERVKAGELPPVEERLPKEPHVVQPGELISTDFVPMVPGEYGGELRLGQESPAGDPIIFVGMDEALIWAPSGFEFAQGTKGNVVKDWEANGRNTAFTFHMREGLRWSDGEPVTMEDVRFAFEDVLYNEEITPDFPLYLKGNANSAAAPAKLEVVDDWTFRLVFDRPYGAFPAQLGIAEWRGYGGIIKPKHYLEQFHKEYASAAQLREKAREAALPEGEDQWFNLFNAMQLTEWMWNATTEAGMGHPTLMPWILKQVDSSSFTYERNPYYFKVDPNGSQLPYMDGILSELVQDKQALTARTLTGEFDYLGERASVRQLSLINEKAERGEGKLSVPKGHTIPTTVFLNMTYEDDNWREVVRDLRFRQALSLAINRQDIVDNFYLGEFAKVPELSNPNEHDVDKANQILDDMGLEQKDDEGFRLGPNGERFRIPIDVADHTENHIPTAELIAEYWNEVGIFTSVKQMDVTVFDERLADNQIWSTLIWVHQPVWGSGGFPDYLPEDGWGPLWTEWFLSQGEGGEEPPDEVKKLYDYHIELLTVDSGSEQNQAALDKILKSHRDNIWNFQVAEEPYYPTFFSNRLGNVPQGVKQDTYGIITSFSMEQWFIKE